MVLLRSPSPWCILWTEALVVGMSTVRLRIGPSNQTCQVQRRICVNDCDLAECLAVFLGAAVPLLRVPDI